jgi:hypothetical protein
LAEHQKASGLIDLIYVRQGLVVARNDIRRKGMAFSPQELKKRREIRQALLKVNTLRLS